MAEGGKVFQKQRSKTNPSACVSPRAFSATVVFTKDGMKVGVRHVEQEKYVDRTQNWVVKAWNMAESSTDPSSAPAAAAAKRRSARNAKPASAAAESAGNGGAKKR